MRTENTQINKIRNEKGNIPNTKKIQKVIRDYFENLYANKLENLEEMDKLLDTYDHAKLNQEDINQLNRSIPNKEIEAAIKSLPKRKVQDLRKPLLNSTKPLKNNQYQHSSNFSMK
jgi:glutamyl-tRNA reductase